MDDRYDAMCKVAKTRSVVSVGLSCFKLQKTTAHEEESRSQTDGKVKGLEFRVQTFNIVLLCSEEYVVDPSSLKFLVAHGFDFNKQYAAGIPYHSGADRKVRLVLSAVGGGGVSTLTRTNLSAATKALLWPGNFCVWLCLEQRLFYLWCRSSHVSGFPQVPKKYLH